MKYINEKLIEFNEFLQDKKIAILGVNYNNVKLIEHLYNIQADDIVVFDKREIEKIDGNLMDKVISCGVDYILGEKCLSKLNGFNIIFRAESYLPNLLEMQAEKKKGALITSELEVFAKLCPANIIAITGSDGKTTTSALIYETLRNSGYKCFIGGDDNFSIFSQLEKITPEDFVVLKLSNKQLLNMEISPQVSIITNFNFDDFNYEYSKEEYIEAAKNIFINQDKDGLLILNYDDEVIRNFSSIANGKVKYYSENKIDDGYIISDNKIKVCQGELRIHLIDTRNLNLRGVHNSKNAACAIMATSNYVDLETSINTIKNFGYIEGRIELLQETEERIRWYDDSYSINPSRTITALDSFPLRNVILITGGDILHYNYEKLASAIVNSCKAVILIGENAEIIQEQILKKLKYTGVKVEIFKTKSLKESAKISKSIAVKGDVILYSPGSITNNKLKKENNLEFRKIIN